MIKLADILQRISRQLRKAGLDKDNNDDKTNEKFIEEKESEMKICLNILQKLKVQYQPIEELNENLHIKQVQEIPTTERPHISQQKETVQQPITQVFDNFNLTEKDREKDKEFLKKIL